METSPCPDSTATCPGSEVKDLHEMIRRRAEEIYFRSGCIPGRDLQNWSQAEQEILREVEDSTPRRAIVIKVSGVEYVGEYKLESSDGYVPGEFGSGVMVPRALCRWQDVCETAER